MGKTSSAVLRAAYYGRVSTAEQVDGTSLNTQRKLCIAEIEKQGWELVDEFVDEGVSGAKGSRPQLDRLLADCRQGDVEAIVVAKLDRFGRSLNHLSTALTELDELGVAFVSVSDGFDSSTPSGRFHRNVMGSVAEFERELIKDRTTSGRVAVARLGFWPGGVPPYGFRLERESNRTRLVLDENESEMLRLAIAEILNGRTVWKTAELLNGLGYRPRIAKTWTYHLLHRMLLDAPLSGCWTYGKSHGQLRSANQSPFSVVIPALITPEQHNVLVKILKGTNAGKVVEEKKFFTLSRGVLISPCGRNMRGKNRKSRGTRWYLCSGIIWNTSGERCDCRVIEADWIEKIVWAEVSSLLGDPERLLSLADDYLRQRTELPRPEIDVMSIDRRILSLEAARTTRVADALKAGLDPELLKAAVSEIEVEIDDLRRRSMVIRQWSEQTRAKQEQFTQLQQLTKRARQRLDVLSRDEQRVIIDALELKVHILGWRTCTNCSGSGKLKGGRGGTRCPVCCMTRFVPQLRIEGIWNSDVGEERRAPSATGVST